MTTYPIKENADLVNSEMIGQYLAALFEHVDWSEGGTISIIGVGEKGTAADGVLRERKFLPAEGMASGAAIHVRRWAQHHGGSFIVPAVVHPSAVVTGDVKLDKIMAFTALMVDLDSGNTVEKLQHASTALGEPSMIIYSGGTTDSGHHKIHAYWKFLEPSTEIDAIAAARKVLAAKVGGDQAFGRATQIIRLPGSLHCKNGGARPVELVALNKNEYDADELLQLIADMPAMIGIAEVPAPITSTLDFSQGAGKPMNAALDALSHTISEGGDDDQNRWLNFSRVAGHHISNARKGLQSIDEARDLTYGWMLSNMQPPWPVERFNTEWSGLLKTDYAHHGEMPKLPVPVASLPNTSIKTYDDLMEFAVHRKAPAIEIKRRILVDGFVFAGKKHLMVAEGGAGKTFLCMDLALKLATAAEDSPQWWMGQEVLPEAYGGTAILITAEDDLEELHIRWNAIDPQGTLRQAAGDRLIAIPLENTGGVFPFAAMHPGTREAGASPRWAELMGAFETVKQRGGKVNIVIVDTLNATLHGEENSATVIAEYLRVVGDICARLGAAFVVTHHVTKNAEPVRTVDEMRDRVRGSTALINGVRIALGFWPVADYERRMKAMGLKVERGQLFHGAVVKANNPDASRAVKTLLRTPAGLLQDVTQRDIISRGPTVEHEAWLEFAIGKYSDKRFWFTQSGRAGESAGEGAGTGLFAQMHRLPEPLRKLGRNGLHSLCKKLLEDKRIITRKVTGGGTMAKWLDLPENERRDAMWGDSKTPHIDFETYYFDHGHGVIREAGVWE